MDSPKGSISETTSAHSSFTPNKNKSKKSKMKMTVDAEIGSVEKELGHSDFVEYEEDDERNVEGGLPENTFLAKIQRLKEIIKLTKPQGEKKSKKKRKMSKEDKDAAGGAGGGKIEPPLPMTEEELFEEK
ncbi:hypothetical protein QAD02_023802 [Eretmocerus hayati]|uniref:Uncharacterized protein n=1 Tax=Eretmocerus hayati TaxID=131215 RepID=A0ACC2PX92_9HYME|nr:hypothetical protein QAD02_023802 [Eretmocerus hayati]